MKLKIGGHNFSLSRSLNESMDCVGAAGSSLE